MGSNRKLSGLVLVAVVAGLSLTACDPEDVSASATVSPAGAAAGENASSGSASDASSPPSAAAGQNASSATGSSSGTSGGSGSSDSGSGSASGSMCKTSNLAISAHHGISGEGQEIVNLTNNGSNTCTMHGFPGVDLKGETGEDGISASRAKTDTPTVSLAPGAHTDFVLNYPFNNSGGSGFTFTTLIITPPNETHSKSVSASINIPLDNPDQPSSSAGITVNAVGAGK